jgi:hypothetical protein
VAVGTRLAGISARLKQKVIKVFFIVFVFSTPAKVQKYPGESMTTA